MKMNYFNSFNAWVHGAEATVVNVASSVAPWLAPLTPAFMTYQHALDTLRFPVWIALPAAVVVEILGFSAVSTGIDFWFFNRRNKAAGKKAPLRLIVFAFVFYLALIVSSNILLDSTDGAKWAEVTVRALFTLQTIPAALIVVARVSHKNLLEELEREKKVTEKVSSPEESSEKVSRNLPTDWRKLRPRLTDAQVKFIAEHSPKEIIAELGKSHINLSPRTASNWHKNALKERKPE
jgi:hypothetical protein